MKNQSKITQFIPKYSEESTRQFNQVIKKWRNLKWNVLNANKMNIIIVVLMPSFLGVQIVIFQANIILKYTNSKKKVGIINDFNKTRK